MADIQLIRPEDRFAEPKRHAISVVWLAVFVGLLGFWAAVAAIFDLLA